MEVIVSITVIWILLAVLVFAELGGWWPRRRGQEEAPPQEADDDDVRFLILIRGRERYVFVFDREHLTEIRRVFGRFASDPELSFTWHDAAVMSLRAKEMAKDVRDIVRHAGS